MGMTTGDFYNRHFVEEADFDRLRIVSAIAMTQLTITAFTLILLIIELVIQNLPNYKLVLLVLKQ